MQKTILDLDPDLYMCQIFYLHNLVNSAVRDMRDTSMKSCNQGLILVNSAVRDMRDTSMKSCDQGLYFVNLHLRPQSKLWGRCNPKTENKTCFLL